MERKNTMNFNSHKFKCRWRVFHFEIVFKIKTAFPHFGKLNSFYQTGSTNEDLFDVFQFLFFSKKKNIIQIHTLRPEQESFFFKF